MGPHWIKQWIANLAVLNDKFRDEEGKVDFEALGREEYAFRMALITQNWSKSERARDTFQKTKASYDKWVENGRRGGRPPKNKYEQEEANEHPRAGEDSLRCDTPSSARLAGSMPDNCDKVIDFAVAENLDVDDARECWYVTTVERDGKTADGKRINNWKAYVRKWCTTRKDRRTA